MKHFWCGHADPPRDELGQFSSVVSTNAQIGNFTMPLSLGWGLSDDSRLLVVGVKSLLESGIGLQ